MREIRPQAMDEMMQTVDLSNATDVLVKIGPYVYLVGPGTKMSIADYLERIECPTATLDDYEEARDETITV